MNENYNKNSANNVNPILSKIVENSEREELLKRKGVAFIIEAQHLCM